VRNWAKYPALIHRVLTSTEPETTKGEKFGKTVFSSLTGIQKPPEKIRVSIQ
jgi:hypothetical protein